MNPRQQHRPVRKPRGKYRKDLNKSKVQPFIKRLVNLFSDPHLDGVIVWEDWNEQYGQILIMDGQRLETEILHKYYRHAKLSSFVRQLNIHGFRKIYKKRGNDTLSKVVFINKYFLRSSQDLYPLIKRNSELSSEQIECIQTSNLLTAIGKLERRLDELSREPHFVDLETITGSTLSPYINQIKIILEIVINCKDQVYPQDELLKLPVDMEQSSPTALIIRVFRAYLSQLIACDKARLTAQESTSKDDKNQSKDACLEICDSEYSVLSLVSSVENVDISDYYSSTQNESLQDLIFSEQNQVIEGRDSNAEVSTNQKKLQGKAIQMGLVIPSI